MEQAMKLVDSHIDDITEAEVHLFVREMARAPRIITSMGAFSFQEFVVMEYKRVLCSSVKPAWAAVFYEPTIDYLAALALFTKLSKKEEKENHDDT